VVGGQRASGLRALQGPDVRAQFAL
jgi:hypothetical protein